MHQKTIYELSCCILVTGLVQAYLMKPIPSKLSVYTVTEWLLIN